MILMHFATGNSESAAPLPRYLLEFAEEFQACALPVFRLNVVHIRHCPRSGVRIVRMGHDEAEEVADQLPFRAHRQQQKNSITLKDLVSGFITIRG